MSSILDQPDVRNLVLPLTVEQYHRLGATGIVSERTELLRGVIVRKMIKSPYHTWIVQKLAHLIAQQLPMDQLLRQEQPLSLTDSEPEPDLAIVTGTIDDYRTAHPATAMLVVEVAIHTEIIDRVKSRLYAEAEVAEYWLMLPERQAVERFTHPTRGEYTTVETVSFSETLRSHELPHVEVDLRTLLGP